jgi:hypothetical protein
MRHHGENRGSELGSDVLRYRVGGFQPHRRALEQVQLGPSEVPGG